MPHSVMAWVNQTLGSPFVILTVWSSITSTCVPLENCQLTPESGSSARSNENFTSLAVIGVPSQNFDAIQFGASGDLPVPADYDGDGKTDAAVYRPLDGNWYLQQTTSGFTAIHFGIAEDKPTPRAFLY